MSVNLEQSGAVDLSAVDQSIVPALSVIYEIGSAAKSWLTVWTNTISTVAGDNVVIITQDGTPSATAAVGGTSGDVSYQTGEGGSSTAGAGGNSGGHYFVSGDGGNGVGNGGNAGGFNIEIGTGGESSAGVGGAAEDIELVGGNGGEATAGSGDGGPGSNVKLKAGVGGGSFGGSPGADGVIECTGNVVPEADGTRNLGVETTAQWANVWADAVNGADFIMANGVRMLEAELYGLGRGFAIGYSPRWEAGKAIWHGTDEQKAAWMEGARPWFLVTEDAVEIHGRRFTPEQLDRLLALIGD